MELNHSVSVGFCGVLTDLQKIASLCEGSQAVLVCPCSTGRVKMEMCSERWWNGTGGGNSQ